MHRMPFRSARLESVLGTPVEQLNAAAVRALVGTEAAEDTDLDFKRDLYGSSERDKRALATDIAALANTSGGVILIGVAEDDQARAADAPGVALGDGEQLRMAQIIAGNVVPVPRFEVRPLPEPDDAAHGFYALLVERTPAAPHAVVVGDGFRYPRRNGASTRYLTEPEVAQAYRDRLAGLADQQARLGDVWGRGVSRVESTRYTYVAVASVPEVRGAMRLSQEAFRTFERGMFRTGPMIVDIGLDTQRAMVSRGYFTADGSTHGEALSSDFRLDAHGDGSTFFASVCAWGQADGVSVVDDEYLVLGVISALSAAARHARDAGASGALWLRAGIWHVDADWPVELGHTRNQLRREGYNRGRRTAVETVDAVADIDGVVAGGPGLIAAAASLADGLVQSLGLAECPQLTPEGRIRRGYFGPNLLAKVLQWAERVGVEVLDETQPQ